MINISGVRELKNKLSKLSKNIESLQGEHKLPIAEVITPDFLSGCSSFSSVDQLIEASGFKVESAEDFRSIPDDEWDTFIRCNTNYSSWDEMLADASKDWALQKLRL